MNRLCATLIVCGLSLFTGAIPPIEAMTCNEIYSFASTISWHKKKIDEPTISVVSPWTAQEWVQCAIERWGPRWDNAVCMHPTDIVYALRTVLEREPTMLEVEDHWRAGCSIVWQARCKTKQRDATGRPLDWEHVAPGSWMLEVLAYLAELRTRQCVPSISTAFEIFNGKRPDPEPQKTAAVYAQWTGAAPPAVPDSSPPAPDPPVAPEPLPPPTPTPTPPPVAIACPAGQQCRPPCPVEAPCPPCVACPALPPPFVLPTACQPIAALRESADVIARNAFTSQQRRQRVANCMQALDSAF